MNIENDTPWNKMYSSTSSGYPDGGIYYKAPRSHANMGSILVNLETPIGKSIWSKDYKTENKSLSDTYPNGGINLFQQCQLGYNNTYGGQMSGNDLIDSSLNDTMFTEISNVNYDSFNYETNDTQYPEYENSYSNYHYERHEVPYLTPLNHLDSMRISPPIAQLEPPSRPQMTKTPKQTFVYPVPSADVQVLPKLGEKTHLFKDYLGNYFDISSNSQFFVIKSYNLIDINASFINNVWSSTDLGNKRLSKAFKSNNEVYLFFLVNGSGKFCGVAKMTSDIDFDNHSDIWSEDSKWKGVFNVEWLLIKDIPNKYFQQFKIVQNDNKSVTNSRDTQEIPHDIGISMLKIFSTFKHVSSFLA